MIKKIFFGIAVLFCILIIAYKAFFYFDSQSEQRGIALNKDVTRLTADEMAQLQEGDIILRRGFG
ncbi:MAG: YiiX/YebB-like N1pC/P60 family cysteine hydrolase, partial [Flavobacterium sp.]